ncbi:MAG: UDP-N-acetylmuramoyl-L-alanyl-D-glutamate--2,6-diaminopimelate ligase [Gammaproteobacteria bacterium]|nr:UDP-N-acetylmuramoyl-L-alanyl-D-glutamate--2,6-diaminopimelate ligase [Gammaproteobacteria bacterium]
MKLADLLAGIVEVPASANVGVRGVCQDSRLCEKGHAFLACAGLTSHGLDYIDQALRLGATVVLWEPNGARPPVLPEGVVALPVPALSAHAGSIAARFHGEPANALRVIGVTGTNGKTSVAHLTANALNHLGHRCAVAGTLGNGMQDNLVEATHTTPDAVSLQGFLADMRDTGADALAMEVSSHALTQHRVAGVHFDTAVFTNLTRDHLDYHGSLENYAAAKRRLFDVKGLRCIVINADDDVGRDILAAASPSQRRIAFAASEESLRGVEADDVLLVRDIAFDGEGLRLSLHVNGKRQVVHAPLFGRFNAMNVVAVFGVLLGLGHGAGDIVAALESISPVRGRMQHVGGGDKPLAIIDYAHTPDALRQVLIAAREHASGEVVCVFGCGGDRDRGKRPEMAAIAEALADRVVVTDDNPRTEDGNAIVQEILSGFEKPESVTVQRDRAIAIQSALELAVAGDVVVVAGKGHEDYQVIGNERHHFSDIEQAARALGEVA